MCVLKCKKETGVLEEWCDSAVGQNPRTHYALGYGTLWPERNLCLIIPLSQQISFFVVKMVSEKEHIFSLLRTSRIKCQLLKRTLQNDFLRSFKAYQKHMQ